MDSFLASQRRYCPLCVQEDTKDYGQVLMHAPHQSIVVRACWKHGIRLVDDALDGACVCSSEEDIKTARLMHGVYMREIIADIRTVQSVVLSDKYMRRIKTLMESGQMDEILQYAEISSLTEFFKFLFASSTQNGANQVKIARAIAQFVDIEDIEKAAPEPERVGTECDLIPQAENKGSVIVSYDFPLITIRCGRCGNVYTTWYQSVTSGLLCPHCIHFTLQRDVSEEMFKVFAQRYGFRLSGERDKRRVEVIHTCGKKLWIDPVNAISKGTMICPACGTPENTYGRNSKKIVLALQRIGMRKKMSCGMEAEIIAYRRAKDIDVEFEDGSVRNTSYQSFLAGNVLPVDKQQYISEGHVGEFVKMRCRQTATVLAYHRGQRVDIQFEDGRVRKNVQYSAFKQGNVSPASKSDKANKRIGQRQQMRNGATATIIAYRRYKDIDIMFDDGEIREHVSCGEFDKGNLRPKSLSAEARRVGEKALMNCGKGAEIMEFRDYNDIDVLLDDGTMLCNVTTKQFSAGTLRPSGEDWRGRISQEKAKEYVGKKKEMRCGMEATIIAYRNSEDIDIQFDDGSIRSGVSMRTYKKGSVAPVHHHRYAEIRVGETNMMSCGLEAVITAYRNAQDMDIRFSDGTVKESCDYYRFKKGELSPARQDRTLRDRKGEKAVMRCGLEAEVVEYRRSNDVDVMLSDGTLLQGIEFQRFADRTLRPRRIRDVEHIGERKRMRNGMQAEIITYRGAKDIDIRFEDGSVRTGVTYQNFKNGRISLKKRE